MKILFLAPYPPYPPHGGGQQRMYQMLRLLCPHHEVHLLTFVDGAAADAGLGPLRGLCQVETIPLPAHTPSRRLRTLLASSLPDMALRGQSAAFAAALARTLATHDFDVVQAESIEMAQYGRAREQPGTRTGGQPLWCYDAFNAEHLLQYRAFRSDLGRPRRWPAALYSLVQWRRLRHYEHALDRAFDLAFAVSGGDQAVLQRLTPGLPTEVIPNGVDTTYFRPASFARPPGSGPYLLFTGTLDYRPNVDAVTWFVGEIWPAIRVAQPNLRVCIVGQRPDAQVQALNATPGVEIIGPVADIRPWFAHAAAYVLPMRVGGGVRLKLLETWAMQVPCVTTSLGAEGVDGFEPGVHALIADEPGAFAQEVVGLLGNAERGRALALAGRQLVMEHYDWAPIVARMEQVWLANVAP